SGRRVEDGQPVAALGAAVGAAVTLERIIAKGGAVDAVLRIERPVRVEAVRFAGLADDDEAAAGLTQEFQEQSGRLSGRKTVAAEGVVEGAVVGGAQRVRCRSRT